MKLVSSRKNNFANFKGISRNQFEEKKTAEHGKKSQLSPLVSHHSSGVSLITLIITIIVIIILAAIVIWTGLRTPDRANLAKFTQEMSDFRTAMIEDYMLRKANYAIEKKTRTEAQIYYNIASNSELEMEEAPVAAGLVSDLGLNLNGTEYYEITDDRNVNGWKNNKGYYDTRYILSTGLGVEHHYVTDKGDVFVLPGYLVKENNTNKYYVNERVSYTGEEPLSVASDIPNTPNIDLSGATKHSEQTSTEDIGIGTDGQPVNLDLWNYTVINGNEIALHGSVYNDYYATYSDVPGYKGEIVDGKIVGQVPQYIKINGSENYYTVTSIEKCFDNCSDLVYAPSIPSTVKSIGNSAFSYCTSLESITIPSFILKINEEAFYRCSALADVTIEEGLRYIEYGAFNYCTNLKNLIIPKSTTSIASSAFYSCYGLETINVKQGNMKYDSRDNCNAIIESATNTLILGCKNTIISNNITTIGNGAFSGCIGLTSITIPNSVTRVEDVAFNDCNGLTEIVLPNSIVYIGESALSNCSNLASITLPSGITKISNNCFQDCSSLTSMVIPENIQEIGSQAFDGCRALTSITIPNTVTSIGASAFDFCDSLTSVTIPSTVTSLGGSVFSSCSKLTNVEILGAITTIPQGAFQYCKKLTNVTIPNTVTSIGDYAFMYCDNLTSLEMLPDSVKSIGNYAFNSAPGLITAEIPDGVLDIGSYAFQYCGKLTSVTVPSSVTNIGSNAFKNCSKLTSITINKAQDSISGAKWGALASTTVIWNP